MNKRHNSSALTKQVSERLGLNQEDGLKLFKELSQIPDGPVKDALNVLSDSTGIAGTSKLTKYAACIEKSFVRDVRHLRSADANELDEEQWAYKDNIPLFIGIVEAETPTRAVQMAASRAGIDESLIELYKM